MKHFSSLTVQRTKKQRDHQREGERKGVERERGWGTERVGERGWVGEKERERERKRERERERERDVAFTHKKEITN